MSQQVWIHRFNANELGLGDRGPFCLVPVEAREIFFPNIDFGSNPEINDTVKVLFQDMNETCGVTYSKPPSKTEHRLSLSEFSKYIGNEASGKPITPGIIGCFYRKDNVLNFSVAQADTVYDQLLKDFPSRGRDNNLVTEAVFVEAQGERELSQPSTLNPLVSIPKPFILLAGISGTGKTRFVREQADKHNMNGKNFCLVPVRPDWHEPSDLLGYISRIGGKPEYVSTKVLQFIIDAWKAVAPSASSEGMGELDLLIPPYWLCLDEMNLAPVEQYFADYLSVLESRAFRNGRYSCDPLLDTSVLETSADIQQDLKLKDHPDLWDFFCKNGIGLPPNLIVAGTVNMDETTHGFSRKVIDRALTIDFGEFFPNDYSKFVNSQDIPKTLTYGMQTHFGSGGYICSSDSDGEKTIAFLDKVNDVLRRTPFELAFRALNEILLHVGTFSPDTDERLQAVWDDFLLTKVLPRIDGDDDKLRIVVDGESLNLLEHLEAVLEKQLNLIWGCDKKRVDLFRTDKDRVEINDILCRSRKKIEWMRNRLEVNTFTSYWP